MSAAALRPRASNSTADLRAGSFWRTNLIEFCCAHPGLLQLLKGTARFDSLMLTGVADQEHAVLRCKPGEEIAHLAGAGQTRFIHEVEMLLRRGFASLN